MAVYIHYLNGNDISIQNHYLEKEYRNDIEIEIDGLFYEVYFFTKDALEYEMTKDGFFSLPGMIILEEITNEKIILAIENLLDTGYFTCFKGYKSLISLEKFSNRWYSNTPFGFKIENVFSYKIG